MIPGGGRQATPREVAQFGHIAIALRKALEAKGWKVGDLNQAIGRPRANAAAYHWFNAHGAPSKAARPLVAKALGISEAGLRMRHTDQPPEVTTAEPRALALRQPQAAPTRPVLQFEVDGEGMARLRLDVALPVAQAAPLLRVLLDAGVIMGDR